MGRGGRGEKSVLASSTSAIASLFCLVLIACLSWLSCWFKTEQNIASTQDAHNLDILIKNRDNKWNRKEVSLKTGSRMNAAKIVLNLRDSWLSFVSYCQFRLRSLKNTWSTKWSLYTVRELFGSCFISKLRKIVFSLFLTSETLAKYINLHWIFFIFSFFFIEVFSSCCFGFVSKIVGPICMQPLERLTHSIGNILFLLDQEECGS